MTLADSLREYIAACFTGIWIESHEQADAFGEIAALCRQEHWRLAVWDLEQGLRLSDSAAPTDAGHTDPLAAIRAVGALGPSTSQAADRSKEQTDAYGGRLLPTGDGSAFPIQNLESGSFPRTRFPSSVRS